MQRKKHFKIVPFLKIIGLVLVQAFLFMNFAWCGTIEFGKENTVFKTDTLSPAIQVTQDSIRDFFVYSSAFQMGKRAEFKGLSSLNKAEVKNLVGEKFNLNLELKGKLNTNSVVKSISKRADIEEVHKKIINSMVIEFGKLDVNFYAFDTLVEDLFGFASAEHKMVAIHSAVFNNPIAKIHEIGEFLSDSGILSFSLNQDQLLVKLNGRLIGSLKLSSESMAIAEKDPTSNHYLLRAFQREVFKSKDRALTAGIKSNQGKISSAMKFFLKSIQAEPKIEVDSRISLPEIDDAMNEALFRGINFSRFSEEDAAKLKIAILLDHNIDVENIDQQLLKECEMLNEEAADLYESVFPSSGAPFFSPRQLFAKENVTTDNVHLIFELAKRYSPIKAFGAKLDRMYRELALYTLPVGPGERYHVSMLKDLNHILLSGGMLKESRHSLGGQGVYFFEMGSANLVDAQTRLGEFFPLIASSPHDVGDTDYVIKAFRQKIVRNGKDNTQFFPVVMRIDKQIPAENAMGWGFRDDYKKSGKLVRNQLSADQYEFLINLNYLYLTENQATKRHLIAKNIITEHNGIIKLVNSSHSVKDENGKDTGWVRLAFSDLRYEVVNLAYTKLDTEIQNLSASISESLKALLSERIGIVSVMDTGSSNRGLTVENPDFDFLIEMTADENVASVIQMLLDEKILGNFLEENKEAFEAIYEGKSISIVLEKPHIVGKGDLYLFPFKFVVGGVIVGGVDFDLSKVSLGQEETFTYHETAQQQLQKILDNVPAAQQQQVSRHIAGEIKTLKKLIKDQGLYKDNETKRNRFIGLAVEQMIYNLSEYLSVPSNVSITEIKRMFSLKTALYLLSRMENDRVKGLSFAMNQRENGNWFIDKQVKYDLRDNEKSVMPKVGTAFRSFMDFAKAENSGTKMKITALMNDFLSRPVNKIKMIEFLSRYDNEIDAAVALGQTKTFKMWDFFERWEFVKQFFTQYKTEIDVFSIDKKNIDQNTKMLIAELLKGLKIGIMGSMGISEEQITANDLTQWFKHATPDNKKLRQLYFQYGKETLEQMSIQGFIVFLMNEPSLVLSDGNDEKIAPLRNIRNYQGMEHLVGQAI